MGTSWVPIKPDNSRATTPDRSFAPDTPKGSALTRSLRPAKLGAMNARRVSNDWWWPG